MTARTATSQHSRRHHLLAGCVLLSLLLHAALLARWNAPVTAAAPAGVSALRVTFDTTGNTAPAEKELKELKELGSDSKFTQNGAATEKFVSAPGAATPTENSSLTPINASVSSTEKFEPVLSSAAPPLASDGAGLPSVKELGSDSKFTQNGAATEKFAENSSLTPINDSAGAIAASVQLELARHFLYPPLAVRRGWQGQVLLAFRVGVNGAIEAAHVAQGSGHALLDRAALGALGKVHRVALQHGPLRAPLELQLPVIYRLEES